MRVRNYFGIGLRCINCGGFLKQHIDVFDGDGKDDRDIYCPGCKKRVLTIEKDRKNYKFEVLCASCGERHKFTVSLRDAIHSGEKKFICRATGATALIIGQDKNIDNYMEKGLERDMKLAPNSDRTEAAAIFDTIAKAGGAFKDDIELFECLEHFKELSRENRINCECGENLIQLLVEEDGFRILCSACEKDIFFGFTDREGIEKIKNLTEIYLK